MNVDELNAMKMIGNKARKFVCIMKATNELLLRCVSEYEEQMMRMIAKNERLNGRIEECQKLLAQRNVSGMNVSYASMADKDVSKVADRSRRV